MYRWRIWPGRRLIRPAWGSRMPGRAGPGTLLLAAGTFLLTVRFLTGIWQIFENAFLRSTPWVGGWQVREFYWESVRFGLIMTILSVVILAFLVAIIVGQVGRLFRRW